jgi:hypothetical protein
VRHRSKTDCCTTLRAKSQGAYACGESTSRRAGTLPRRAIASWKVTKQERHEVAFDRPVTTMQDRGRKPSFSLPSSDQITEKGASALQTPCNTLKKNLRAPCLLRIPPPLQSVEARSPTNHSDPKIWDAQPLHSASPRDIVSRSFVERDGPRSQLNGPSNPIYWAAVA